MRSTAHEPDPLRPTPVRRLAALIWMATMLAALTGPAACVHKAPPPTESAPQPEPTLPVLTAAQRHTLQQQIFENTKRLEAAPTAPDAPAWQVAILTARQQTWDPAETRIALDTLVEAYAPESAWANANAGNPEALASASSTLERTLRVQAATWHNTGRKLRAGPDAAVSLGLAEHAYRAYLDRFPEAAYATELRYQYAELLYKLRKFDEAFDLYMRVVAADPHGPHAQFCAESAIFAAGEVLKTQATSPDRRGAPRPLPSAGPVPLTPWQQRQLDALDQFSRLYPEDPKNRNVTYKAAYLLYNQNRFKDAAVRFEVAIRMDPASKEAEQAAYLVLDSFSLLGDWESLAHTAETYAGLETLGSPEFRAELKEISAGAMRKISE